MVIFIGRSIEQAVNTSKKLDALGFVTHIDPLLKRSVIDVQWTDLPYTHIIFTSQNAILSYCDSHFPKHIPCIVVGDKTKYIAQQNGLHILHNAQGSVQDIISYIDSYCQNPFILYPTTEDARTDLEAYFLQRNIQYKKMLLYKMLAKHRFSSQTINLFRRKEIHFVLLYSQKFTDLFFDLIHSEMLASYLQDVQFLCLYSPDESKDKSKIPQPLQNQFFTAKMPDESSLFDMLQKLAKNRHISIHNE